MDIPEPLLMLAGFVFAHATWSVSDLPEGDLLVPLAMVETSGQRQLLRFEADTQEEAIAQGKATLAQHENMLDAWAIAREGQIEDADGYGDVLTIEAKASGMTEPVVFVQGFQPFAKGAFKLIGQPMVVIGGKVVAHAETALLLAQLEHGIQSHEKAAELWPEWL